MERILPARFEIYRSALLTTANQLTILRIVFVPVFVILLVYRQMGWALTTFVAAGLTALTLYLMGLVCFRLFGLPAPVAMLFIAVLAKLAHAIPASLQQGSYVVYRFFATGVTYPLLFAIGVAMTPWDRLMAALALPNLITIVATVTTLMITGFGVARWVNLYPIEAAIVNACHSGQGGTGDVAILTAANRMQLMPFAQIATRIGGAITVTLSLIVFSYLH